MLLLHYPLFPGKSAVEAPGRADPGGRALSESGYQEIVLTGINLSCYGQDLGLHLWDAVEAVCGLPGVQRVLGFLRAGADGPAGAGTPCPAGKAVPSVSPFPSKRLRRYPGRMNRHYTAAEYEAIVENIRKTFTNPAVTTDIMVGFAGETQRNLKRLWRLLKPSALPRFMCSLIPPARHRGGPPAGPGIRSGERGAQQANDSGN